MAFQGRLESARLDVPQDRHLQLRERLTVERLGDRGRDLSGLWAEFLQQPSGILR